MELLRRAIKSADTIVKPGIMERQENQAKEKKLVQECASLREEIKHYDKETEEVKRRIEDLKRQMAALQT